MTDRTSPLGAAERMNPIELQLSQEQQDRDAALLALDDLVARSTEYCIHRKPEDYLPKSNDALVKASEFTKLLDVNHRLVRMDYQSLKDLEVNFAPIEAKYQAKVRHYARVGLESDRRMNRPLGTTVCKPAPDNTQEYLDTRARYLDNKAHIEERLAKSIAAIQALIDKRLEMNALIKAYKAFRTLLDQRVIYEPI